MNDMSLKAKIRNLANEKGISAAAVLQSYLINRFLFRLADSEYKDKFIKNGSEYTIKFADIDSVNITKDPYGFKYQNEENYVTFNDKNKDIVVNVKSCVTEDKVEYCYEIADVNTKDLDTDSIKTSIN